MHDMFTHLRTTIVSVTALALVGSWSTLAPAQQCVGDCDANGFVSVNELIRCVRIALGQADVDSCPECDPNGDGSVRIPELITAVSHALCNCQACATRPPTQTPSNTPTSAPPTATPPQPTATKPPVSTLDGGVLFGQNCVDCHDNDAGDIDSTSVSALSRAIDDPFTGMDIFAGRFSAEELQALSNFMSTVEHSTNWSRPTNHGAYAAAAGVSTCQACHGGSSLRGDGDAPSCFRCHEKKW